MSVTASITLKENSYSTANNTSSVTCKVIVRWTAGSWDHNNRKKTLTFDGHTYSNTKDINPNNTTSGSQTLFSVTRTVAHNSNGTKTVHASATIKTGTSSGTVTASKSLALTNIPRYATVSQSVVSKTNSSITMKWTSNAIVDYIWWSSDNGSTWHGINVADGTSGTYTISGLTMKTTYNIKTRVRRKDSQLTTDSSALAVTTYDSKYFDFSLDNVDEKATMTSLQVQAVTKNTEVSETDQTSKYAIKWTWYISGNAGTKNTANTSVVLSDNGSVLRNLTNLVPGKNYIVTADLYKGAITSSNTVLRSVSVNAMTSEMTGTFRYTARTSNAVNVELKDLPVLPYATKVNFYYKKDEESTWVLKESVNIAANEQKTVPCMFTGLSDETEYNFRAVMVKGDSTATTMKTFEVETSTLVYVPGLENMIPYIERTVIVPRAYKSYIKAGVNGAIPEGLKLCLYKASSEDTPEEDYTKDEEFSENLEAWTSASAFGAVYYRLGFEDTNGNIYNMTEPYEIVYTVCSWDSRIEGMPFDITAAEMREAANAMISAYDYLETTDDVPEDAPMYYGLVKERLDQAVQGEIIRGGDESFTQALRGFIFALEDYGSDPSVPSGSVAEAFTFDEMFSLAGIILDAI